MVNFLRFVKLGLLWGCLIILSACNTQEVVTTPAVNEPAQDNVLGQVAIQYLTAKTNGDEAGIRQFLCSDLEDQISRELNSFANLSAQLEDATCTANEDSSVTCTGQIVIDYGGEARSFPLGSYQMVEEDGDWKWCGEVTPAS